MPCGCENGSGKATAAADQRPDAELPGVYGNGTVLDNFISTRGRVISYADGELELAAEDANYPGVRIMFEEGVPGVFRDIRQGQVIFVSFSVTQLLESIGDKVARIAATAFACFLLYSPQEDGQMKPADRFQEVVDKYEGAADAKDALVVGGISAGQALVGFAVDMIQELSLSTSPICFYAIIRAAGDSSVVARLRELAWQSYLPYETDCIPATGPGNLGVVNVVFRLRHTLRQTELAIMFPVRLRTFAAIDPVTMFHVSNGVAASTFDVSVKAYCSPNCLRCRRYTEYARAACITGCSVATGGVGLAACILACNIAADERKARC